MKISPVVGTPTIPNPSSTGLAPEKLARLKAIAAGESNISVTPRQEDVTPRAEPKQLTIKMKTDRTIHRGTVGPTAPATEPESAIPDTGVQANAVPEVTAPLSPQLVALQKERRALQQERQALAKEKESASASRAELESRIKANALSVLQELGVTYDQLTNEILANQNGVTPEINALKAEIKSLKEGVDKTLSDKDTQAEQAVLREMRRNVNTLSANGDDFEMIRETGSQPDVIELIHRTWKDTGEVLDEAEAMALVEQDLLEQSLKIAKTKKVQGKLTPPAPVQPHPDRGMRTLTNKDSASPVMDRRQRAIQAALGNLKR